MAEAVQAVKTGGRLGATERRDAWWATSAGTAFSLLAFIIYATFRALMNERYHVGPYLSPFYSPNFEEWFGEDTRFAFSPAILILWIPAFFRLTCYYFRKAYYRAYFLDPPACAVSEPSRKYKGETGLLVFQNLHRYALYFALLLTIWLWVDVFRAFYYQGRVGVGVASLVLLLDTVLLTFYTLSCHSLRHLVGGCRDCFRGGAMGAAAQKTWSFASLLNTRHMLWAWVSLFWVMFADLYVWMVASGRWTDLNTWGELEVRR